MDVRLSVEKFFIVVKLIDKVIWISRFIDATLYRVFYLITAPDQQKLSHCKSLVASNGGGGDELHHRHEVRRSRKIKWYCVTLGSPDQPCLGTLGSSPPDTRNVD